MSKNDTRINLIIQAARQRKSFLCRYKISHTWRTTVQRDTGSGVLHPREPHRPQAAVLVHRVTRPGLFAKVCSRDVTEDIWSHC